MNDIANRILAIMRENLISYADLAKKTGIPKSALQRYATGSTLKIPMDRLETIATALNVSAAYLIGWEDDLTAQMAENSTSGRTAAKEEMYRTFGVDHQAADLRLLGDKIAVLYYKAMERHSAPALLDIVTAVEDLSPEDLEKTRIAVRAYLRADVPIKEIVDTALKPYREKDSLDSED